MLPNEFTLVVYSPNIDENGKKLLRNTFGENVHILEPQEENEKAIELIREVREDKKYPLIFVDNIVDYGLFFIQEIIDKTEEGNQGILWPWALDSKEQREVWSSHIRNFKGWYIPQEGTRLKDLPEVCKEFLSQRVVEKKEGDEINKIR